MARLKSLGFPYRKIILASLVIIPALGVLVWLGSWQVMRLAEKEALLADIATHSKARPTILPTPDMWQNFSISQNHYRNYSLSGSFSYGQNAYVHTQLSKPKGSYGGVGFWVFTPFRLKTGGIVVVNRGFIPKSKRTEFQIEDSKLQPKEINISGLLLPPGKKSIFSVDADLGKNIFYWRDLQGMTENMALSSSVAPFFIEQDNPKSLPAMLPQAGETRLNFSNRHLGYAITWYGLAFALFVMSWIFLYQTLRRPPPQIDAKHQ